MPKVHFCKERQCSYGDTILRYVQGDPLTQAVAHFNVYRHHREQRRYDTACTRFIRYKQRPQQETQHVLSERAKYDEAHCLMFHHLEDVRSYENNNFSVFQAIPRPRYFVPLSFRVSLPRLKVEVSTNKCDDIWTTPEGKNLDDIVTAKMGHPIHIALGSPLVRAEMTAIILYTGTRVQPSFNDCHRKGDINTWKELRLCLQGAVEKLHQRRTFEFVWRYKTDIGTQFAGERVSDNILKSWNNLQPTGPIFGGSFDYVKGPRREICQFLDPAEKLAAVVIGEKEYLAECVSIETFLRDKASDFPNQIVPFPEREVPKTLWSGTKKTRIASGVGDDFSSQFEYFDFLSTSTSRQQAAKFLGTGGGQGVLFSLERDETAVWADVTWISKFPHEDEILFAPTKWQRIQDSVHTEFMDEESNGRYSCLQAYYRLAKL